MGEGARFTYDNDERSFFFLIFFKALQTRYPATITRETYY